MVKKTIELAEKNGWFFTRQFENEANADYHSRTTAREIVDDFAGERLDYWVTGFGTGGTLKGVGRVLDEGAARDEDRRRASRPMRRCSTSGTKQDRNADGSPASRHPAWKPHPIQGWSPDFIPKLAGDAVDMKLVDRVDHRRRARGDAVRAAARAEGRHLRRHLVGRDVRRGARGLQGRAEGLDGALHAARHGRALSQHAAVCRHPRRHERRRDGDRASDLSALVLLDLRLFFQEVIHFFG